MDAAEAIQKVGLADKVNMLPDGMNTHIVSGGKGFSHSFIQKLILARLLVKQPRLMILNDFFTSFEKSEKDKLINLVMNQDICTIIAVSNDPLVMEACDKVVVLDKGSVKAQGSYAELLRAGELNQLIKV